MKFFVFGAPGSGILKAAEELYSRDDFKKSFKQDPIYKRPEFPKDVRWHHLKESIDNNYNQSQVEPNEIHGGWWIYKYFEKIKESYPDSYYVFVSRHSRESLQKIGVQGSPVSSIELHGGEELWAERIKEIDEILHTIVDQHNWQWHYIESDENAFNNDFSVIDKTEEPKVATVKISIGKL